MDFKTFALPVSISFFMLYELLSPFYSYGVKRFRHALVNISLAFIAFIVNILFVYIVTVPALSVDRGLSSLITYEPVRLFLAILFFDMWMYIWHRLNHEIPFFWRFHKVHHADIAMDATTGVRFHPAEVVLSTVTRAPVYILIGVNFKIIAVYEILMALVVIFHHSNIRIHPVVDDILSLVIPTPRMHRLHHSDYHRETDSNYGTIFSLWDRLFRTFNSRRDVENVRIGLKRYREERYQSLSGLLKIPFT